LKKLKTMHLFESMRIGKLGMGEIIYLM